MIYKHILLIRFLNEPKFIFLHTVNRNQVLLYITNNSIKDQSFIYTHLKGQIVLFLKIQFNVKPMERTLSSVTISGHSGSESHGNKGVLQLC